MAKMFYTMEEAKVALGRSEDEVKQLARDGKLREFRDGPRLMFKADQVEALKGTLEPKDDLIDIADSGAPIALAGDSRAGTGGAIPLAGDSRSGSGAGSSAGSAAGININEDSRAGDLGLGGSFGGVPSPRTGSRGGSGTGMNIFNPDESDDTKITAGDSAANLEAVGSGSGLLDLTRESDDTSLGAVLDEISPGKRDVGGTKAGTAVGMTSPAGGARAVPVLVQKPDPSAPMFAGLALGGAIVAFIGLFMIISQVMGSKVPMLSDFATKGLPIIAGGLAVIIILFGLLGFVGGKLVK